MGAHRVLTVDLHSEQIQVRCTQNRLLLGHPSRLLTTRAFLLQGFFQHAPVDNLFAEREFITYFRSINVPVEQTVIGTRSSMIKMLNTVSLPSVARCSRSATRKAVRRYDAFVLGSLSLFLINLIPPFRGSKRCDHHEAWS